MGAQGTAVLNFGAFPGGSDASVVVTGQAGILSGSLVEAWIYPLATADHSADEHMVETLRVFAHSIVVGTGFTISGFNTSQVNEPLDLMTPYPVRSTITYAGPIAATPSVGGIGTRIYGQWTVGWVWN